MAGGNEHNPPLSSNLPVPDPDELDPAINVHDGASVDLDTLLDQQADELFNIMLAEAPQLPCPSAPYSPHTTVAALSDGFSAHTMYRASTVAPADPSAVASFEEDFIMSRHSEQLKALSDDDLDGHFSSEYLCKFGKPSDRRSNLTIVAVCFVGQLFAALIDSGCSARCMIDTAAMQRAGLPTVALPPNVKSAPVVVGDGRVVETKRCRQGLLDVCNYKTTEEPTAMPLGSQFDMVLGKAYLEDIEMKSKKFRLSFVKNSIDFTLHDEFSNYGKTKFSIKPNNPSPAAFQAPRMSTEQLNALMVSHTQLKDNSSGTKMVMVTSSGNILNTFKGDDYLPCNDIIHGNYSVAAPPPPKEPPDSNKTDTQIITESIGKVDPANLAAPQLQPNWTPSTPSAEDDFSDDSFMDRVKHLQNTPEKLSEREEEVGVPFIQVLRDNGQVFRDDVPTRIVPDRGKWNAELQFADPQDAHKPINLRSYRLSPAETRALALILRDMLLRGTIRPSTSPWGAPVFLVPKSDGGWRLCCDYRLLNSKLVHESYSLPASDQLFDLFKNAKYFSTHDCTWGYHQLRWGPSSVPYTAIKTHLGTFEFLVMNFGPTSSPAQWQRLMETILRGVLGECCVIFLDDLCVYSNTAEEHMQHLNKVYRLLAKNSIYLRFAKCFFFNTQFKFLGWIIKEGTMAADPDKVSTLTTWPNPENKREVRSFTGFTNFYRRLIPKYTDMMAPLFELQRDHVPNDTQAFVSGKFWTPRHEAAFQKAKLVLTSSPVVSIADPDLPYHLYPDASEVAVGGVLEQRVPGKTTPKLNTRTVVEYLSKRLNEAQSSYPAGKLELLAIIVCLKHWRHYLLGCKLGFTIHTDHEPLLAIKTTKNPSRMYLRWQYFIEQFRFDVDHTKGTDQPGDFLSRPAADSKDPSITITEDDSSDDVVPVIHSLLSSLASDELPPTQILDSVRSALSNDPLAVALRKDPAKFRGRFKFIRDLVFYVQKGSPALYIPDSMVKLKQDLFDASHSHPTAGHFGAKRTIMKLQRAYYWQGMAADVTGWVRDCNTCMTTKRMALSRPPPLPHDIPHHCWEVVFMDETSGFPPSSGYDAIWVFVDKLSKMAHFVPVAKEGLTSEGLAKLFFQHVFRLHGMPRVLVSDRDNRIDTEFWQTLFKKAGTISNMSTSHHPQTDSSGEATVRMVIDLCRRFVNSNQDDWYELLPALEFGYNDTPTNTGFTPFEINYGRHPRSTQSLLTELTLGDNAPPGPAQDSVATLRRFGKIIRDTRAQLKKVATQVGNPAPVIAKQFRGETFKVGDMVYLHRSKAGVTFPQNKMAKLYVGPFPVVDIISRVAYKLGLPKSMQVNRVVNIQYLRRAPPAQRPFIASGPPDQPGERIDPAPLIIRSLLTASDENNITDLLALTDFGVYDVHELCRRGHYQEVLAYVSDSTSFWSHVLPYNLGRRCRFSFARGDTVEGIITAYDPDDEDKTYQIDFEDVTLSLWTSSDRAKRLARPKKPVPTQAHSFITLMTRPLRVLELCCGPHASFSSAVRDLHPDAYIITLDIDASVAPSVTADVLTWDYLSHFPSGFFDLIWASPPCTQYSPAKTSGERDITSANNIVMAVLDIINSAQPSVYFVENPHTNLWKQDFMAIHEDQRNLCSFCMYGTDYRKNTDIWSNIPLHLQHCSKDQRCACFCRHQTHLRTAQTGPSNGKPGIAASEANAVPYKLCLHLLGLATISLLQVKNSKEGTS